LISGFGRGRVALGHPVFIEGQRHHFSGQLRFDEILAGRFGREHLIDLREPFGIRFEGDENFIAVVRVRWR
jgi:hypothetical protein